MILFKTLPNVYSNKLYPVYNNFFTRAPQYFLNHLEQEIYTIDFSDDVSVKNTFPSIVGMTKSDDIEMVTRDVMFELDGMNDEAPPIPSPISTEMLEDDQPLRDMDTTFEFSNMNLNINYIDHHNVPYNQVKLTPNGIRHRHYELGKANIYYNTPSKAVDHDDKVKAEMSSIFQTPR
jgi:hypothetical protein